MSAQQLFNDVVWFIRRYVVVSAEQADTLALWLVHTHAFEAATFTPYLHIRSAELQSGKSLTLDVLDVLCARPWRAVTPSEAVTFRKIAQDTPTLLLDEVDAIFGSGKAAREHEGLRALLNAGFRRRGSTIPRCVGEGSKIRAEDFATFCAKAFAAIGRL